MFQMALIWHFFAKKSEKLPSGKGQGPQALVCMTFELHEFARHAARL